MRSIPILLGALLLVTAWVLVRRARAARAARAAAAAVEFERFVGALPAWSADWDGDGWRVSRDGQPIARLPLVEVLAIAERADRRGRERRADGWAARLSLLRSPIVPLGGPLSLKLHGPRVLPRPSHPETLLALPETAAVGRSAELACPLLYVVAETEPLAYVPEAAVREAGIDVPALHGVATAVLRQRLDPALVGRVLAGEVVEVRPADGCGAARLSLLPELLSPGQRLAALALDPETLLLAPLEAADHLAARLTATRGGPREALLDRVLEVRSDGVQRGHR